MLAGGWHFSTEVARVLGGAGAATPEEGARAVCERELVPMTWQLASLLVLALALAAGFAWYERSRPPRARARAGRALAALAVVGRLAFAAIPNVKPTTDIVLFAGYALGAAPGFAVGAIAALVSNVFLVQGPWTPWQMAGWGGVGRRRRRARPGRCAGASRPLSCWRSSAALAGLAFGAWMDLYQWTLAAQQDLDSYLALSATSLPYNLAHAIGNVVFCLLIGPAFIRALRRYRRRFEVRWPAPAPAIAAALLLVLAAAAPPRPRSPRASRAEPGSREPRTGRRLRRAPGPGVEPPLQRLGRARPGRARAATRATCSGAAAARCDYISATPRSVTDIGEIERTVLVLRAAGLSPRDFGGRDLVAAILRQAPRRRLDRGLRELHGVRDPGAAVGGRVSGQADGGVAGRGRRTTTAASASRPTRPATST